MRGLVIPFQLSGSCVERHQTGGVQILSRTASSVVLVSGVTEGDKDQAIRGVDGHRHPRARAAAILPSIGPPGTELWFAGLRYRMESPDFFAGLQIEGARVSGDAIPALLSRSGRNDRQILVNSRRRAWRVTAAVPLHHAHLQIDNAVIAHIL